MRDSRILRRLSEGSSDYPLEKLPLQLREIEEDLRRRGAQLDVETLRAALLEQLELVERAAFSHGSLVLGHLINALLDAQDGVRSSLFALPSDVDCTRSHRDVAAWEIKAMAAAVLAFGVYKRKPRTAWAGVIAETLAKSGFGSNHRDKEQYSQGSVIGWRNEMSYPPRNERQRFQRPIYERSLEDFKFGFFGGSYEPENALYKLSSACDLLSVRKSNFT